jgi:hypothetical protein
MKLYDVIRKEEEARGDILPQAEPERPRRRIIPEHHRKFSVRKIGIIGGSILLLVLFYLLSMRYVHAKVIVTERRIPFTLRKETFEIPHEQDKERLSFQTMVVTTEITREVYGGDVRAATSKARGQVVFFNEYSTKSQTVKSGTTLTASTGKRYSTQAAIVVPGYTMEGKLKKPGTSTPVSIVAADTGVTYNSEGTTFAISGWNAKQLYARSAGEITGGGAGAVHAVSEADRPQVIDTLKSYLTERLKRETRAQIPDEFITFPNLQFVSIDTSSLRLEGSNIKFPAQLKGTMVSYLIPRDALESAIAACVLSATPYPSVSIPALSDLDVLPVSAIPTNPAITPDSITISVTGEGTIIAKVPVEHVKEALIGRPRRAFITALTDIAEIDNAQFRLLPFWAPLFPRDEDSFTVLVK